MKNLQKIVLIITLFCLPILGFAQCSFLTFKADTTQGCAPTTIRFAVQNFQAGSTFSWDFGNGFTFPSYSDSVKYNLYKFQGIFDVKLKVVLPNAAVCNVNKYNYIKINGNVNILVFTNTSNLCKKTDTVTITDSTLMVKTREWVIDGVKLTDTSRQIKYTFGSIGFKQISIKISTTDGCVASQIMDSAVTVWDSVGLDFNASKYNGCPPFTSNFVPLMLLNGQKVKTYNWGFPNAKPTSSNVQSPKVTYTKPGDYDVSLQISTIQGCTYKYNKIKAITVYNQPKVKWKIDRKYACLSDTIMAQASITSGLLKRVQWDFNPPGPTILDSSLTCDSMHFNLSQGGSYAVTIRVSYDDCEVDTIINPFLYANELRAEFDANYKTLCVAPDTVTFINQTIANSNKNIKYKWLFYDSAGKVIDSSTLLNPSHIYKKYGKFKVSLQAYDDTCFSEAVKSEYIKILQPDSVQITAAPNKCCTGEKVNFSSQRSGFSDKFKSRYIWKIYTKNFDSLIATDTNANPKIMFKDTGIYAAVFIAYNMGGCADTVKDSAIVHVLLPEADFKINTNVLCLGQSLTLTSLPVTKFKSPFYNWIIKHHDSANVKITMGGSMVSTPLPKVGSYDIYHIYGTATCQDTFVKYNAVTVNGLDIIGMVNYTQSCVPLAFSVGSKLMYNVHAGNPNDTVVYYWTSDNLDVSFSQPDSPTTNVVMPVTGCFKVSLQIANSMGCNVNYPDVFKGCAGLYANFKMTSNTPCVGDTVYTVNKSGLSTKFKWYSTPPGKVEFLPNDSVSNPKLLFNDSGNIKVSMIAFSQVGCSDTATYNVKAKKIFVDFYSPDTVRYCGPSTVTFYVKSLNNDYYEWDFGDGSATIAGYLKKVSHVYDIKKGKNKWDITFKVTDNIGCNSTIIKPNYIKLNGPVPSFDMISAAGCDPLQVTIKNTSQNCLTTYLYNDIGGLDSSGGNPTFTYNLLNKNNLYEIYRPYMYGIDSNRSCKKLFFSDDSVLVYQRPKAKFSVSDTVACANLKVNFYDSSFAAFKHEWDFNNDGIVDDTNINTSKVFTVLGNYTVKLKVENIAGCVDSAIYTNLVRVTDTPNFEFDYTGKEFCFGEKVSFILIQKSLGSIVKVHWDFGDPNDNADTANIVNPDYIFKNAGHFPVSVYVETDGKCYTTISKDTLVRILAQQPNPATSIIYATVLNNQDIKVVWGKCPSTYFYNYKLYRNINGVNTLLYTSTTLNDTVYIDKNAPVGTQLYDYEVIAEDRCFADTLKGWVHNNILLNIDTIGKNAHVLNWRPYHGWPLINSKPVPHTLYRSTSFTGYFAPIAYFTDDSSYIDSNLCDSLYFYYIIAANTITGDTSMSNLTSQHPNYLGPDTPIYLKNVTVVDNNYLLISWDTNNIWDKTNRFFMMRQYGKGPYLLYQTLKAPEYEDRYVDIENSIYHYKIIRQDQCLVVGPAGNEGNNIVLRGTNKDDITYLHWNEYKQWKNGVKNYRIELYNYTKLRYDVIDSTTDTTYTDKVIRNYIDSAFCYHIVAVENDPLNPANSMSNMACVKLPAKVFFPNAFTPNNDNLNEVFKPTISFVHGADYNNKLKYRFEIFDRWGGRVFLTNDPMSGWDGKINGVLAEPGVYVYTMESVSFLDLQTIIQNGSFHLLRGRE
ncbi:MAG: gliding motility-associated C-terminal domain-containing protein [Bacteroidota bacterium]|nr:gliding motility-associated C-terminal domain-containing protein [Bacteroidota bacterium]